MVVIFEGVVDGLSHLQLGGTVLVAANHGFIQESTRAEDGEHGGLVASGALRRLVAVVGLTLRRIPRKFGGWLPSGGFLIQGDINPLGDCVFCLADVGGSRFGGAFSQKVYLNSPIFLCNSLTISHWFEARREPRRYSRG